MKAVSIIFFCLLLALPLCLTTPQRADAKCPAGQALDKARESRTELEAMIARINKLKSKYSEAKTVMLEKRNTSVTFKAGTASGSPVPISKDEMIALDKYLIK